MRKIICIAIIPEHVRCCHPYQYTTYKNASLLSPNEGSLKIYGTYITLKKRRQRCYHQITD